MEKTQNTGLEYLPYKFMAKELDEETGLYYYGARYLNPKYSMWISTDPALGDYIPKAPINEEAKKHNQNLPGMGGVFNHINGDLYAYAGNNPVKYTDPDGRLQKDAQGKIKSEHKQTITRQNTNSKTEVYLLFTNKGNPIIGIKKTRHFAPDILGREIANGEYILQPNDLSYKDYKNISDLLGIKISKAENLKTILQDEFSEVSSENACEGDLFIRYDNINGDLTPAVHGEIKKIQKGLFGYKYSIEHNGQISIYTAKDFSNGFKIYKKNDD